MGYVSNNVLLISDIGLERRYLDSGSSCLSEPLGLLETGIIVVKDGQPATPPGRERNSNGPANA